ncbi:hypothetical protein S7711_04397 [Stachybotrys chartarum IBT 7711]|uniref:Uncharacterized protein n=1 Tax=Stachybotrys chartarum (strain CBS 109288 / IBT 7711) TaxID=1280523 RepID=A0A084B5H7_STACB|nr:hypothetical protein S7711_04397 [Stachybotrys chartarum IBT 7711]
MFSLYHLPAVYFAFSHTGGPLMNPKKAMILYGLPPWIADAPEASAAWNAGKGRTTVLGILMHIFYWTGQYDACDTMLMGVAWLGINDFFVCRDYGDKHWAWTRLVGSFAFAGFGFFGLTQGRHEPGIGIYPNWTSV